MARGAIMVEGGIEEVAACAAGEGAVEGEEPEWEEGVWNSEFSSPLNVAEVPRYPKVDETAFVRHTEEHRMRHVVGRFRQSHIRSSTARKKCRVMQLSTISENDRFSMYCLCSVTP